MVEMGAMEALAEVAQSAQWKGGLNWEQFNDLLREYPWAPARIVHSVM